MTAAVFVQLQARGAEVIIELVAGCSLGQRRGRETGVDDLCLDQRNALLVVHDVKRFARQGCVSRRAVFAVELETAEMYKRSFSFTPAGGFGGLANSLARCVVDVIGALALDASSHPCRSRLRPAADVICS